MQYQQFLLQYIIVAIVGLSLTGCGLSPGTSSAPNSVPDVTIEVLEGMKPEIKEIRMENISQHNCGGTAEVENQVERSRAIERIIEVQGGLEINTNGQIGFAGTDVELGATIAGQLGHQYGTVENLSRSLIVKAKAGTNMAHRIRQLEIWEVGSARIMVNGQEIKVPFRFRNNFSIELVDSEDIGCSVGTTTPASIVKSPNIISTLTSTPRPTLTPVDTPTRTPVPSPTNTTQPTQTPTKTPKPTLKKVRLYKISLQSRVNESTFNGYATPPLGDIELGGVQFDLPRGQNSITTQAETLSDFPTRINMATEIFSPEEVYLLITGGNTFSQFSGKKIGVIRLIFRDNEPLSVELVAGYNIREWKLLDEHTVSKTTSEQVKEVWRTESNFGGVGIIDMLTIGLPTRYRSDYLETIEIIDTSTEIVGSKDPAINLIAVTVKGS